MEGYCCVREAQRRTAVWPRSTTDVSTFPPGVSRSDEIPHVSHVVIKVMRLFPVLSRLSTNETLLPTALEHVVNGCAYGIVIYHENSSFICVSFC